MLTSHEQAFQTFTAPVAVIAESWGETDQQFQRLFQAASVKGDQFIEAVIKLKMWVLARSGCNQYSRTPTWERVAGDLGYTVDALDARIRRHQQKSAPVVLTRSTPADIENKVSPLSADVADSDETNFELDDSTADSGLTKTIQAMTSSASDEWYTPSKYIEAARLVLGVINLDPASCEIANRTVKAEQFFTKEDDGLAQRWDGQVWLNPPYGKILGPKFVAKLIHDYNAGLVTGAILLVNSHTASSWFQPLYNYPICFTNHRIRFNGPGEDKDSPTRGNAFVYFGTEPEKFAEHFRQFGAIEGRWVGGMSQRSPEPLMARWN